jgi:ATP-dependent Clp protease, protease subunit
LSNVVPIVTHRDENTSRQIDIFSRLLKDRVIMLVGPIEDDLSNIVISQLLHLESENSNSDISIYINSPGGSVTAALAIYDVMKYIKPKVNTICIGQACSAASLLLCAGDRRLITKHSRILLHQPIGGTQGQAADLHIYVKEILIIEEQLLEIYHTNTGISKENLKKFFDRDTIFRGKEAVEIGLVDEVVVNRNESRDNHESERQR